MKKAIFIITLIISNTLIAQQLTQTIRGTVVDQLTQQELPGATISVITSDPIMGTITDIDGRFRIEDVPIGRQTVKISFIGYKNFTVPNIIVNAHKEIVLTIDLEEEAVEMEELIITDKKASNEVNNQLVTISARGFDSEETSRYAGSFDDPSRMVANYAGVSGANDSRNDIIVRGNSPLGVLWRLDGIDIPNPNHFSTQGANGGPVSILNNNLLSKSDFLTGAFPAEYGNRSAAVFDIRMRHGNDEKYEFTSQFGFNGLELMTEGPIHRKSRSSFVASYRYSTLVLFDLMGIDLGLPAVPIYEDLSFKLHFPTKKFGNFALIGIGGISGITIIDSERKRSEDGKDLAPEAEKGFDVSAGSKTGVLGLTNKHIFSKSTYGKYSLAISGTEFNVNQDSVGYDANNNITGKFQNFDDGSNKRTINSEYILNHKINTKHFVKSGIKYSNLGYRLFEIFRTDTISDSKGSTDLIQSFVHWQWKINGLITANFGIHHQSLLLNNKHAIEPRLGLKWSITEKSLINLGAGLHNQMNPLEVYLRETKING
ncbi:MAG: carboxypeptidase-like regulatory domain-containing protein, partial [Bacteroidia bacterium]|nr:carboxypeptidase-like regulatory domain-containing protein [Bacteroidia bacterium]